MSNLVDELFQIEKDVWEGIVLLPQWCKLSERSLCEIGIEFGKVIGELVALKGFRQNHPGIYPDEELDMRIALAEQRHNYLGDTLNKGAEYREVTCMKTIDLSKNKVTVICEDTREVIQDRPILSWEREKVEEAMRKERAAARKSKAKQQPAKKAQKKLLLPMKSRVGASKRLVLQPAA
jgi:hypothetical protein